MLFAGFQACVYDMQKDQFGSLRSTACEQYVLTRDSVINKCLWVLASVQLAHLCLSNSKRSAF